MHRKIPLTSARMIIERSGPCRAPTSLSGICITTCLACHKPVRSRGAHPGHGCERSTLLSNSPSGGHRCSPSSHAGQGRCPKQVHNPLVSGQFFVTSLWPFGTSSTIFSSCSEPLRTDDVLNRVFVEEANAVAARRNVNAAACTTRGWLPKEVAHAEEVGGGLSEGPKHAPACLPMTDITLCCSAE